MSTPVKIIGPFATSADTARALGVSPARRKQLEKLVDDLLAGRDVASGRHAKASRRGPVSRTKRLRANGTGKSSPHGNNRRRASK
jgi:hypothetical protein